MKSSASVYRSQRLKELLDVTPKNTPQRTAEILRDHKGLQNADIGLTNEKAMNQFIAHHSIIFEPKKLLVWVSTAPWQEGAYICYDLNNIFSSNQNKIAGDIDEHDLQIQPDEFLYTPAYQNLKRYLFLENELKYKRPVNPIEIVSINPMYYDAYRIAGDEYSNVGKKDSAVMMYKKALTLEVATEGERDVIEGKLAKLKL